jgi:hypothetical protein
VGKPEGNGTIGRPRRRWDYNIKMALQDMGCGIGSIWFRIGTGGWHAVML